MKKYGLEITLKADQLIKAHKDLGMDDELAKKAALLTLHYLFTTHRDSDWQKVYNHLTGVPCPYNVR